MNKDRSVEEENAMLLQHCKHKDPFGSQEGIKLAVQKYELKMNGWKTTPLQQWCRLTRIEATKEAVFWLEIARIGQGV